MASLNKAMLIGRLGQAPELKYTQSQTPVAQLSIATHEVWRDKNGEKKEDLQWHRVVVWGKQAENVQKYLTKGDMVYIEGKIQTREYTKNDEKRYATEIVAKDVKFMPRGSEQPNKQQPQSDQGLPPKQPDQPSYPPQAPDSYSDIPF